MSQDFLWHNLSREECLKKLISNSEEGLSEKEARERQYKLGKNKLPEEKPLSGLKIFLSQFRSPLIYILIIAGIVTFFLKEFTDTIVIFSAVFLNTIVGFLQENKTSKTLQELKKIIKHAAEVLREGNLKIIDSEELVPGDIFILNVGDKVPSDGRVIESHNLKINEMILTGEWIEAKKTSEVLSEKTPLADRDNMVYMGCVVEEGKGKIVATETGIQTEIGKVATMVRETEKEKTPYQKKIAQLSKIVGIIIGLICLGIFIEGIITGGQFIEMFTTSIAVAVAAIPEGLPVAMTVILALGMQRILKKNGLVRKLNSAETLGSTSIIATDKTATLTEGKMEATEIRGNEPLILKTAIFNSEAFIENPQSATAEWILRGRPTEKALLMLGIKRGLDKKELEKEEPEIDEILFSPVYKYSASLRKSKKGENTLYILGAPEIILERSKFVNITDEEKILPAEEKIGFMSEIERLANKGQRILGVAMKKTSDEEIKDRNSIVDKLTFLGFIVMRDPLREDVRESLDICRKAGMKIIIVTGDHKLTAKAVAEELGFKIEEENILEGKGIDEISDKEFNEILDKIQIYARVEPRHKLKIIQAWQERGEVVAMTGDGVNDAPALKRADIGVALGSGTEVAKETSDLVLLNDSFSIIVAAVEEGRAILDNIRKVITYLLSDSFTEVILIGVSIVAGLPLPVTAVQILWVNLIEDGLPDIALAFEPKEKDIMEQKPGNHKTPLLNREMKAIIFIIGIITDLILLGIFFWLFSKNYSLEYLRTMIFAMLGIDSISYVFCCKSLRRNLWQINIFDNKFLVGAWVFGLLALLVAVYLPVFNTLLGTVPLSFSAWGAIISLGLINIFLIETAKYYFIHRGKISV